MNSRPPPPLPKLQRISGIALSAHAALECLLVVGPVAAGDEVGNSGPRFTSGDAQPVGSGGAADRIDTPDFGPLLEQCSNAVRGCGIRDRRARWQLDQRTERDRSLVGRKP